MIKCMIIDDEPMALDVLRDYVNKVPFLQLEGEFRDAVKALNEMQSKEIDLIFLDIEMPDLTGIQFLKTLTRLPMVIFTTAYSEYAVESYDFEAVDYLLKPIEFERFLKASNRALELFTMRSEPQSPEAASKVDTNIVLIKSGTEFHQVRKDEILYIEGAGNYVFFVTSTKKIMALMTMQDVLRLLSSKSFIRIHKSYIVSFEHVDVIEPEQVRIGKKNIPIGEVYKTNLQGYITGNK
ncbi:MAG: response regulator transcription factor [bacterium]|nr:response regulator transcription factor [bacterium]